MRKGISPLVASVLLIAITIGIAAILASWVSGITKTTMSNVQAECIGGSLDYSTADYPKYDAGRIVAVVDCGGVSLSDFKFNIILQNDTSLIFPDTTGLSLDPGETGTVISADTGLAKSDIKYIWITTNCANVKTEKTTIR